MQIAGSKCTVCGCSIVLSREGKFCARCGTCVHLKCEPRERCGVCGQPLRSEALPDADPFRDAILPRALRPSKGGPLTAALLIIVPALLLMIFCYACNVNITGHGPNEPPAPNRLLRLLDGLEIVCAPLSGPAAVGEAQR